MSRNDWIALGVIAAASYLVVRAKQSGAAGTALSVHYTANVGWVDSTQSVQYDETTGNLYDELAGSKWIGQVAAGLNASVFARPDVQAMITQARAGT